MSLIPVIFLRLFPLLRNKIGGVKARRQRKAKYQNLKKMKPNIHFVQREEKAKK